MRDRVRTLIVTAITLALAGTMLAAGPVAAAAPKVVIIVGPTGGQTADYRSTGDEIATTAQAAGATVVKVYSPNATWANVRAAVNGANFIVYLGHGNGYPNPYSSTENTDRVNGWGVNKVAGGGGGGDNETNMIYCGEQALLGTLSTSNSRYPYCAGGISPAPGFVMIYNKACYAPGASEPGNPSATESMAYQRVRHFSYPVLTKGASAYFATDIGNGASVLVDLILRNPTMTYGDVARNAPGYDAVAQRHFGHPDLSGKQVWIQRTSGHSGMDYWFAYAGNPAASFANPNAPPAPPSLAVVRHAGADRYATAAAVSAASFAPGVSVAYVATGANFPDALAGGAAAAVNGGPVLLVSAAGVPDATAAELDRLNPDEIVVLGGSAVVSSATMQALQAYASGGAVRRLAGASRYETAAAISADTFAPGVPVAYLATGANFPDALAGTPPAGSQGGPVLLTTPTDLPAAIAAELDRLDPGRIVILGAAGAVSNGVASQLGAYTSGSVTRLSGSDRYATAVAVSSASFTSADTVYVATGASFPDALAGGPVAGRDDVPLLLVPAGSLPDVVRQELLRLGPATVVVLGGTGVVSNSVVSEIQSLFP